MPHLRSFGEFRVQGSQKGTKSHLKKQSHQKSKFPPEMTLLKSEQNIQSCLKSNFLFTPMNIYLIYKVFKMTGVILRIGRLSLIHIYLYQSISRFL